MKLGFLEYLLSLYKKEKDDLKTSIPVLQTIIIDQKEKLPMLDTITKYKPHVKIIEFTGLKIMAAMLSR